MAFIIVENWMNIIKLRSNTTKIKYIIVKNIRNELRKNIALNFLGGTKIERAKIIKD